MTIIERSITIIANIFAIGASGIAIYLFLFKRSAITSAFRLLINYSHQLTLSDLKTKLERLNDFNASDNKQKSDVINILNEIEGQIIGNKKLKTEFADILKRIQDYINGRKDISEPSKRSLVSELRENLRALDMENFINTN